MRQINIVTLDYSSVYIVQHTFSFSEPSSFRSSLFFNLPGASAMGRDEWNTNNFPEIPAACANKMLINFKLDLSVVLSILGLVDQLQTTTNTIIIEESQ